MGFIVHLGPDQRHSPKDKGKGIRIHNLTLAWLKLLYVITLFTAATYWTEVVIMSKVCFLCVTMCKTLLSRGVIKTEQFLS